ncbi:pentatricopeptide repeat-containing protein [Hordeum vulgare]|nr:pentatricopeptide repeat-containing protein [Hordeum vulgare]
MHALLPPAHPATSRAPPRAASVPGHLPPPPPSVVRRLPPRPLVAPLCPLLATANADPECTLSLLESLPSTRCPPLRETHLIPLLRSLPPCRALHLLDQLPSRFAVSPSFLSYNTVLAALARANCHADVLALYRRMVHRDRIPPTTFTFGVAARALCRLGRADEALVMLRSMARHGCVPDVVLYQTVIHALCEQGEVAEATTLLDEMFLMGCSADVNTFNDIVHGLCMLGRLREATRLVDRMMTRGCLPNSLSRACAEQGRWMRHAQCSGGCRS